MLGTGTNPDTLFPVDGVTELARALFVAMISNETAQARYLAIYGEPYFQDDASFTAPGNSAAISTTTLTVR